MAAEFGGSSQGLLIRDARIEAEAVTLTTHSLDAYYRAYTGIVLCPGVGNYFNTLNITALQACKFSSVCDFSAIDINLRSSFAYYFKPVLSA